MFILWKNFKAVLCTLIYLSFKSILLSNILIVGMYLVMNGIPMILYFISEMWKVFLKGIFKSLFCSIVLVGTRKNCIFP